MAKRPAALVGFPSIKNTISVETRAEGIHCRVSTRTYFFVLIGTATFGPALGWLFYFHPEKLEPNTPRIILMAAWFLILLSSVVFVRYLAGLPRFTVLYDTGEIIYFAWWWGPSLVLGRDDIRSLELEERFFLDEGTNVPNYCMILTTTEGRPYALCVSTNRDMIAALKDEVEKVMFGSSTRSQSREAARLSG